MLGDLLLAASGIGKQNARGRLDCADICISFSGVKVGVRVGGVLSVVVSGGALRGGIRGWCQGVLSPGWYQGCPLEWYQGVLFRVVSGGAL